MALTKISGSILKDPLNLGEVSIGGTLTYQDVTNVDSVGIITARQGIRVPDGGGSSNRISVGDSEDLKIYHNGSHSYITDTGTGDLKIGGATRVDIGNSDLSKLYFRGTNGGGVGLYHNNVIQIGTYDSGLNVYGDVTLNDSIIHRDDANTKIRFPSNDTISFETGGSERLRITSGGAVNIGDTTATSNSDRLLQIGKTDRSATYLELRTSTSGAGGIVFSDGTSGGNDGYRGTLEYIHSSDYMVFKTAATERLRIESGGDLRFNNADSIIHTSADTSKLRIFGGSTNSTTNGAALALHGVNNSSGNYAVLAAGSGGFIRFSSGTTERFHIATDGELTSTANNNGQIIHSFKNDNTTAGSSAMTVEHWFRFNRSGGGMNASAARIIAGKEREWIGGASNQDGYFAVHTTADETSTEKMRISSGGIMTRPFQPAFSARGNSSPVDSSEGYTGILSNYMTTMTSNIGSHYKTSGSDIGKFVAPVAGNYYFSAGCLIRLRNSSSSGSAELSFYKNGSNISARSLGYSYVVGSNDHDNITINSIIPLAAGDKVHLGAHACSSPVDFYWGQGLGNFQGYLIG